MRALLGVALVCANVAASIAADDAVPWQAARDHVGRTVTIEGFVEHAERRGQQLALFFDPDDQGALRVTLLIPLVTNLPPEPERLYDGRRVQAHGRIQRVAGRLDMIVTDPDRITVLGLTAADAPPEAAASDPAPSGATAPAPGASAEAAACARERAAWEQERAATAAATENLAACLTAGRAGCPSLADALAPHLTRLEWAEQRVVAACGPSQ